MRSWKPLCVCAAGNIPPSFKLSLVKLQVPESSSRVPFPPPPLGSGAPEALRSRICLKLPPSSCFHAITLIFSFPSRFCILFETILSSTLACPVAEELPAITVGDSASNQCFPLAGAGDPKQVLSLSRPHSRVCKVLQELH